MPDSWCVPWGSGGPDRSTILEDAGRFGIDERGLEPLTRWVDAATRDGRIEFYRAFVDLEVARSFAREFINAGSDLYLLGVGMPEDLAARIVSPDSGSEFARLLARDEELADGDTLGWQILCFDGGLSCCAHCNHLEVDFEEKLGIKAGRYGLIADEGEARAAAAYCNRNDVGSEPGDWLPWVLRQHAVL